MELTLAQGIIIAFIVVMLFVCFHFRKMFRLTQSVASIITVLGVLGTFVGIAYGLYEFDPENIEASVPILLGGLKIAFVTSIVGIFLAVILKYQAADRSRKEEKAGEMITTGATIDDLASSLAKIYESQKEEGETTRKSLESIEKALTGEGETTVVTQIQKMRTTFSDKQDELINKQDKLIESFNKFATKMAEYNYAALIKALQVVIRDFNAKINEQFGENFKQLNQAVEKILVWQEQYREQMDELAQEFRVAAKAIEDSQKALTDIAKESEKIGSNAEKLEPILNAIEDRQKNLEDHLSAFSDLSTKAGKAFPIIEDALNKLTSRFSTHVEEVISYSNESVKELIKSVEGQKEQLTTMASDSRKNIEEIAARTGESITGMFQDTSARIEKQLVNLDEQLSNELAKSIQSLGSQLTSLSSKFVDDYEPLTEKLKDVVQIARST